MFTVDVKQQININKKRTFQNILAKQSFCNISHFSGRPVYRSIVYPAVTEMEPVFVYICIGHHHWDTHHDRYMYTLSELSRDKLCQ